MGEVKEWDADGSRKLRAISRRMMIERPELALRGCGRRDNPPRQLIQPLQAAELSHPLFRRVAKHEVRRLVPGRAGPAEDDELRAVFATKRFAHRVPEVGIHGRAAFHFLGGAGDVDRRCDQPLLVIPKEKDFHPVVFVALDAAKVGRVCLAVHLGPPVGIHGPAILGDDASRFLGAIDLDRAVQLLDGAKPRNDMERDLCRRIEENDRVRGK